MFKILDSFSTAIAPVPRHPTTVHSATSSASTSGASERTSQVVDSSSPAAIDVTNLFARFGATEAAVRYREIHSDADAAAAVARWPLLAEWLALQTPAQQASAPPAQPKPGPRD